MNNELKALASIKSRIDLKFSIGLGLVALLVYGLTLAHCVFPGESARLMATYTGLTPLELPLHPLWGAIVSWLSTLSFLSLPVRLNLFSAICSVISVVLMYRLVSFLIYDCIREEYSTEWAPRAAVWAGVVAATAFMFAIPVWHAATRLQYQSFDLMLVLISAMLLVGYATYKWHVLLVLFALLQGIGVVESIIFVPLAPVFLTFLIYVMWRQNKLSLSRVAWLGVVVAIGLSFYYVSARHFFLTRDVSIFGYHSVGGVLINVLKNQLMQLRSGLPHVNWLILLMMSVIPWLAGGFASFRALNNERSWSQYILHFTLSVLVVLSITNVAISPWMILRSFELLPVWAYAMVAMTAGYLVAYWFLLLKVTRPKIGSTTSAITKKTGDWLGLILTYPLAAIVILAAIINAFECRGSRGAFADRCAKEILDRMGERTWFVTDGTLDTHLQIMAKQRGQELNLLCLQNDMNSHYLKSMARFIEEKNMFSSADLQRMKSTLELGILPFIQDWFAMDKEIEKKVVVFGVPDLWFTAGMTPVPEYLFFSGSHDINVFKARPLFKEYTAFWKEMDTVLFKTKKASDDPTIRFRIYLRRHMGFIANNLGVLLEDIERNDDAFAVYNYIYKVIDADNISTLFNRFEIARRGVGIASASKETIENELKVFVSGLKHQYPLWSLSRYYGYVRSPEIFARLGWGWALSGQTGAALAGVTRAINLLPTDQRGGALQAMAAIYALADDRGKTAAVYHDIIKSDPNNRSALLGLARLAVQEGTIDKAKSWLEKATKSDDPRGMLGVEWAVIHLMNNNIDKARLALQETTDLQPKNLQAWAMLAMVQLQQNDVVDIEKLLLPRMEAIAGTSDNYFIQITRAQVAMRKKSVTAQRTAREAFIRASILRPDIPGIKDMILQLDIAMNDQAAAELHARQVLRVDRQHSLANYIMGSLRLQEGAYGEAEDFLRRSVNSTPVAAALNDLAEVLRRIRKFEEAERRARESIKLSPDLYVAWETLAVILLEANLNLDEAEQAIKKSMALNTDDLRVQITFARILLKKNEVERAREIIRKLKNKQNILSRFDQTELDKLEKTAASARQNLPAVNKN